MIGLSPSGVVPGLWRKGEAGDIVAPTLSNPVDTADGISAATGAVDTDEGNGTLYWVVTTSSTGPSAAQVKAGQDHTGAAAADAGSQAVSGTGTQTLSPAPSGLTPATAYWLHFMHEDAAANQSAVVSGNGFTTAAIVAHAASGGSFTTNNPTFTSYLTDDLIFAFAFRGADTTAIIVPNLGFGDNRDWQVIQTLSANSAYSVAAYKRAGSDGSDGGLGTWTNAAFVRYLVARNIDWADPIGGIAAQGTANGNSIDHPGVTLQDGGGNSLIYEGSATRDTSDGQAPGLRSGATSIALRSTPAGGGHGRVARSTDIPVTAWAADNGVASLIAGTGGAHVHAVEIRGVT